MPKVLEINGYSFFFIRPKEMNPVTFTLNEEKVTGKYGLSRN